MEDLFTNIHDLVELTKLKSQFDKLFECKTNEIQDKDDILSYVKSHENFLSQEELKALSSDIDVLQFTEPQIRHQPHTGFLGPRDYSYGIGRNEVTLKSIGCVDKIPSINNIKNKLEKEYSTTINSCQVNWYKDTKSSLNFHKDDEPSLDNQSNIFIISLGQTRNMCFRKSGVKSGKNTDTVIPLTNNSLMVFSPGTQAKFLHSVAKGDVDESVSDNSDRYSLVFRTMLSTVNKSTPVTKPKTVGEPHILNDQAEVVDSVICGDSIIRDLVEGKFNKRGKTTKLVKCSGKGFDIISETLQNLNVDKTHVKSLIIHAGTNDIKRYNLETIEAKASHLIDSVKAMYPNAEIFISSILPRGFSYNSTKLEHKLLVVNRILHRICKSKVCFYVNSF